jgi:hypothetical protein
MNVTQTTSRAARKAVMGGGMVAPAVAAHARKSTAAAAPAVAEGQSAARKAVMGGGMVAPAVAAHVRRDRAGTSRA